MAVHRGVYKAGGSPPTFEQSVVAACVAAGGVASHATAATLWEMRGWSTARVEVTVAGRRRPELPGVVGHCTGRLDRVDVARRGSITLTSPARTLLDLGAVGRPEAVEFALEDALHRRLVTTRQIGGAGRSPRPPRPAGGGGAACAARGARPTRRADRERARGRIPAPPPRCRTAPAGTPVPGAAPGTARSAHRLRLPRPSRRHRARRPALALGPGRPRTRPLEVQPARGPRVAAAPLRLVRRARPERGRRGRRRRPPAGRGSGRRRESA